jgi:hypothetical protein
VAIFGSLSFGTGRYENSCKQFAEAAAAPPNKFGSSETIAPESEHLPFLRFIFCKSVALLHLHIFVRYVCDNFDTIEIKLDNR